MTRYLLIALILLAGCVTQKRCMEKFPVVPSVLVTYKDTVIYRDTTIYRYLPGDTVEVSIPVDTLIEVTDTSITARTYLATAKAEIRDQELVLGLVQHDSLFRFLLDSAIREHSDTVTIERVIPVEKPVVPKWALWTKIMTIVGWSLIVLMVALLIIFK